MARLRKLLSAILRDMVAAQHEAYLYANSLSAAYRGTDAAALPAVCLGETELTLHCGFTNDTATEETLELDGKTLQNSLQNAAEEIAAFVVQKVIDYLLSPMTATANDVAAPVTKLTQEDGLKYRFVRFLSDKLTRRLAEQYKHFIADDGSFDFKYLQDIVLKVIDEQFLFHQDLNGLFETTDDGARQDLREKLQSELKPLLRRILKEKVLRKPKTYDAIEVAVSADALANLPETCIQTLRMKILPHELPIDTESL